MNRLFFTTILVHALWLINCFLTQIHSPRQIEINDERNLTIPPSSTSWSSVRISTMLGLLVTADAIPTYTKITKHNIKFHFIFLLSLLLFFFYQCKINAALEMKWKASTILYDILLKQSSRWLCWHCYVWKTTYKIRVPISIIGSSLHVNSGWFSNMSHTKENM